MNTGDCALLRKRGAVEFIPYPLYPVYTPSNLTGGENTKAGNKPPNALWSNYDRLKTISDREASMIDASCPGKRDLADHFETVWADSDTSSSFHPVPGAVFPIRLNAFLA